MLALFAYQICNSITKTEENPDTVLLPMNGVLLFRTLLLLPDQAEATR